jgi:glycosyltransferase involved in cell wall biosynthesis
MTAPTLPDSVCFLGYGLHPPWDEGTRVLTRDLIRSLLEHSAIDPVALSTIGPGEDPAEDFPARYVHESVVGRLAERAGLYRYNTDVPMMYRLGRELRRWTNDGTSQLVHAGFASHSIFSAINDDSVPFVAHAFGGLEHRALLRLLRTRHRVDAYVTSSRADLAEFEAFGIAEHKRYYVPPVVRTRTRNTARARELFDIPMDDFVVGYLGNVNQHRFPFGFAERLNEFASETGTSVIVFTKQIEDADIRALPNVDVVVRSLSEREKDMALSVADAWVFPFQFTDAATAPIIDPPLTVLEAMSAGTAVVASRTLSLPEVIDDGRTGFLHAGDDYDAFVDTLRRLRTEPTEADAVGERARSHIRDTFSAPRVVDALHAVYSDVVERSGSG